jgi:succinyl-CoA synthetase alpha subunit
MAILLDQDTKILFQGLTGPTATRMAERAISNGNQVVGGVRPGKGGSRHLGLPIFDTVQQAVAEVSPDATAVFVPPQKAADAMIEAIEAEVPLIVCVTERIAVQDMLRVREALNGSNSKLVGPNSYGVICPGLCRIGVMPDRPHQEGSVGIVSRSATLAYLAVGDPVHGLGFADCLSLFAEDPKTKAVVLIGEVGGKEEEQAAAFLKERKIDKPVIAFVAGRHAPPGRRMGHAGTMNFYGGGSVADKIALLKDSGAIIAENPSLIGRAVFRELQ